MQHYTHQLHADFALVSIFPHAIQAHWLALPQQQRCNGNDSYNKFTQFYCSAGFNMRWEISHASDFNNFQQPRELNLRTFEAQQDAEKKLHNNINGDIFQLHPLLSFLCARLNVKRQQNENGESRNESELLPLNNRPLMRITMNILELITIKICNKSSMLSLWFWAANGRKWKW